MDCMMSASRKMLRRLVTTSAPTSQQRHKAPRTLPSRRELLVAVPDMHSQVNLARIVRTAALFGISEIIAVGRGRMDREVSRGAEEHVDIRSVRSLLHPLKRLQSDGYSVVGLEQTAQSHSMFDFRFPKRCVLLVGHERHGVADELLEVCDAIVEIPTYGTHSGSHNASTAAMIGMYEYARQHEPEGEAKPPAGADDDPLQRGSRSRSEAELEPN
jgi:tRNA G18 (ribose-2'-O)-methylase SpoU